MSLPFYNVTCTGCSYTGRYSFNVWYEFDGGLDALCQPTLTQGWCYECECVLTISIPQTEASIRNEIAERESWINEELAKRSLHKFLLFPVKVDEQLIQGWKKAVEELKSCIGYWNSYQCSSRCLTCGSTNVARVELPSDFGHPVPIRVGHTCGGQIVSVMSGRVNFGGRPKVVYNVQGNIVYDER